MGGLRETTYTPEFVLPPGNGAGVVVVIPHQSLADGCPRVEGETGTGNF